MTALQSHVRSNLHVALEAERDRLRASLMRLSQAEQAFALSEHEESRPGGSQADVASDMTEQTLDLSLEREERMRLAEVEAALKRLVDGDYGVCAACGQAIDPARLAAIPWTSTCVRCARG